MAEHVIVCRKQKKSVEHNFLLFSFATVSISSMSARNTVDECDCFSSSFCYCKYEKQLIDLIQANSKSQSTEAIFISIHYFLLLFFFLFCCCCSDYFIPPLLPIIQEILNHARINRNTLECVYQIFNKMPLKYVHI